MNSTITIRNGEAADYKVAQAWLAAAGLPTTDLTPQSMENFLVAEVGNAAVGMIGLQQFAQIGLLRSLIVDSGSRSAGAGQRLVASLEIHAAASGIVELWLLTIDTDRYFADLGYQIRDRESAPESIQSTEEYSKLCPGDAVLMSKAL